MTVQSAAEVTSCVLSGLNVQAIYYAVSDNCEQVMSDTYYCACVWVVCELGDCISGLAIVQECLVVRSDTSKEVSRWRESDVLDELGVGLD